MLKFCASCLKRSSSQFLTTLENNNVEKPLLINGFTVFKFDHLKLFSTEVTDQVDEHKSNCEQNDDSSVSYIVSKEDFKWIRHVLPPSVVPDPPKHDKYPTPSGWSPPSETLPDLPYYVPRSRYHNLPVYVKKEKNNRVLTQVADVDGDIWALEKDLIELVRPLMTFDPATRVHEVTRTVFIKGDHGDIIKDFLLRKGF